MKIEIDTFAKTVRIIDTLPITELVAFFKKDWPDQWKDYSIILGSEKNTWSYYPYYPWDLRPCTNPDPIQPTYICNGTTGSFLTSSTLTVGQLLEINN